MSGINGYIFMFIQKPRPYKTKYDTLYYIYNQLLPVVFFILDILLYWYNECLCYIGVDFFSVFGILFVY